jgi:hypothetical protein
MRQIESHAVEGHVMAQSTGAAAALECPCCGYVLALPAEVSEGAPCSCGHCGNMLRNDVAARSFRWAAQEPYIRRNGVSRANLWGGLIGALAWLPALIVVMLFTSRFDIVLLLALAAPYLVVLAVLRARRARTPPTVWMMEVWIGFGSYLVYLLALHVFLPQDSRVVFDFGGLGPAAVGLLGFLWLGIGLVGKGWYRRRAARLPCLFGQPPAA